MRALGWFLAGLLVAGSAAGQDRESEAARLLAGDLSGRADFLKWMGRRGTDAGARVLVQIYPELADQERSKALYVLGYYPEQPGVLDVLFDGLEDEVKHVRSRAWRALARCRSVELYERVLEQVAAREPRLVLRLQLLGKVRGALTEDLADPNERWRHWDSLPAWEALVARRRSVLLPLLEHDEAAVRAATVPLAAALPLPDALDHVAALLEDGDAKVRAAAGQALTKRGDLRGFEERFRTALAKSADACYRLGCKYGQVLVARVIEEFRVAAGAARRAGLAEVLRGAMHVARTKETQALVTAAAGSDDPELRALAAKRLEAWSPRTADPGLGRTLSLSVAFLVFFLLGGLIYVCAFRLLRLRRVLGDLPIANARSAAQGRVAVRGVATVEERSIEHPVTGERCVWYPGAPVTRFRVSDETGSVLVEPTRAALLSEDGMVTDGEVVHVVGTARRDTAGSLVVMHEKRARSWFDRSVDAALRVGFGLRARSAGARLLFEDPRACFCIWDDARERPLACLRETLLLFCGLAFAGAWLLVALLVFVSR